MEGMQWPKATTLRNVLLTLLPEPFVFVIHYQSPVLEDTFKASFFVLLDECCQLCRIIGSSIRTSQVNSVVNN